MLTNTDEALQTDILAAMRESKVDDKLLIKLEKYRSNTIIFDHMVLWHLTNDYTRKAECILSLKDECNFCCN